MHFKMYGVFYSLYFHQHISATITAILRVMLLLQNTNLRMWLAVSPSFRSN